MVTNIVSITPMNLGGVLGLSTVLEVGAAHTHRGITTDDESGPAPNSHHQQENAKKLAITS